MQKAIIIAGFDYLLKNCDLDREIEECNTAIALKSDYAEASNGRGRAYYDEGKIEHALENYNTAIVLNPNYGMAYCTSSAPLGLYASKNGKTSNQV